MNPVVLLGALFVLAVLWVVIRSTSARKELLSKAEDELSDAEALVQAEETLAKAKALRESLSKQENKTNEQ